MRKPRGVWLTNVDSNVLDSQQNIVNALEFLAETGFNVVFPVVWNKGFTLFKSQLMKENFGEDFEIDPKYKSANRDPLQEVIDAAKPLGIKVIPWFEYGFAFSHTSINNPSKRIFKQKLEDKGWIDRDKPAIDNGFEWLNVFNPEVRQFLQDLIFEVATKYDVDGIQGDDRLPAFPAKLLPAGQTRHSGIEILTQFLRDTRRGLEAIGANKGKNLLLSIAPHPRMFGLNNYLQDTKTWLQEGLVDLLHPQLYRHISDAKPEMFEAYKKLIDAEVTGLNEEQRSKIAPAILIKVSSFLLDAKNLQKVMFYNYRSCQVEGAVFFFFEGLRKNGAELAKCLRSDLYTLSILGDRGPDVIKIQFLLNAAGFDTGGVTGIFDDKTESAVRNFQASQGFATNDINGVVTEKTLAALGVDNFTALGSLNVSKNLQ